MVNVINYYNVDFILPISKIDENIEAGLKCNAAVNGLYWNKLHLNKQYRPNALRTTGFLKSDENQEQDVKHEYRKMKISDILAGYVGEDGFSFPGYLPLIRNYMEEHKYDKETTLKI